MITSYDAFATEEFKDKNVLINLDKLPLHQQLKIKRICDGFSQDELVDLLGLADAPTLSRIENGRRSIPSESRKRVYKYLYEENYAQ